VLPLVKAKYLAPLNDTAAIKAPNANSPVINVGGKVYAASMGQVVGNLVANHSLMDTDGVTWPETFPALLEACKAARAKSHSFFAHAGSIWNSNELLYSNVSALSVYGNGESFNVLRNQNKATFSSNPAWIDVMNKIVQMKDAKCFQDGVAAGTFADIDANFIGGKSYAAFIPGSLSVGFSNGPMKGKTLKTHAFPGAKRVSAESNYAFGVNAKTSKLAAAKKFINFASSAAGQKVYAAASGAFPLKIDANTKLPEQYSALIPFLKKGMTFTHPKTTWNTSAQVTMKLGTGIQGLFTGQASVGQVLRSADAAW
jgi:raffinose/stachyose/melibiose transport system substrate-binding protein